MREGEKKKHDGFRIECVEIKKDKQCNDGVTY